MLSNLMITGIELITGLIAIVVGWRCAIMGAVICELDINQTEQGKYDQGLFSTAYDMVHQLAGGFFCVLMVNTGNIILSAGLRAIGQLVVGEFSPENLEHLYNFRLLSYLVATLSMFIATMIMTQRDYRIFNKLGAGTVKFLKNVFTLWAEERKNNQFDPEPKIIEVDYTGKEAISAIALSDGVEAESHNPQNYNLSTQQ